MPTNTLQNKPLIGNKELKLALTHIRTWFVHHNLNSENFKVRLDFMSMADAAHAETIFKANMDPEDNPLDFLDRTWDYNGVQLKFDCSLQHAAKIVREKNEEIDKLRQEIAVLQRQLEKLA